MLWKPPQSRGAIVIAWGVWVKRRTASNLGQAALPVALRARVLRLLETVENVGLEALRAPHVQHLEGKLWGVRAEGGIARGIYVTAAGRRLVVLHVFAKKSRKTPQRALATARERMRQVVA